MKIYFLLAILTIVITTCTTAQNTYNYNQGYNSMNNVLARQQEETRAMDQHYKNVYSTRSSSSISNSYSTYSWKQPVAPAPVKKNYSSYGSNSYNWGYSYQEEQERNQREAAEAAQRRAAEERLAVERELARKRMEAEIERLRREKEAKLLQERLAYLETRKPALKANPFQTIYTPPTFTNNTEKFNWYYDQAYNLSGITDPYACLIVSQMALDGEGTTPTIWIARQKNNDAVFSSLSLYVAGRIMIQKAEKRDYDNILIVLKGATDYTDPTNGHLRAYKLLLELYRANNLLGYALRKDKGNEADVYAFAARNGDERALKDLKQLIADNVDSIQNFSYKQLKSITAALPVTGSEGDYGMHVWNKWGEKMQAAGDTACFSAYMKSFENQAVQKAIIHQMHIRMLHLYNSDTRFAKYLTRQQYETIAKNALVFVQDRDNNKQKGFRLTADDCGLLYKYYSGHCGVALNPDKAVDVATQNLEYNHRFTDLHLAALAYRIGTGGWPKDDAKASALFAKVSTLAPESSKEEKEEKAKAMAATADFWVADPVHKLTRNNKEINYYLMMAARLDSAYALEYADWCADKKSLYYSKENALLHYQKAIDWHNGFKNLAQSAEMFELVKIIENKIDLIKKSMAVL